MKSFPSPFILLGILLGQSVRELTYWVSADLGFEDCSAKVTNVPDEAFKSTHLYVAEHEEIYAKVCL